jgi:hypothetical protein
MLGNAIEELESALREQNAHLDAGELEGVSALRPRLAQLLTNLRTAQRALESPPVFGLQAERHQGGAIVKP